MRPGQRIITIAPDVAVTNIIFSAKNYCLWKCGGEYTIQTGSWTIWKPLPEQVEVSKQINNPSIGIKLQG